MAGFFSRIIDALIGKKEEVDTDKESMVELKGEISKSQNEKRREQYTENEERTGGILYLIERAYNRAGRSISKRSKDPHSLALGAVATAVMITVLYNTEFFFYMRGAVLAILFILLAAATKLTQKLFPFVVGFDMCLFFTVLFAIAYHPITGIIVGITSSALGSIARGQFSMDKVIFPLFGYFVVGIILMIFPAMSVFSTGMLMALIYALIMSAIFWGHIEQTITFFVTTMIFNYWLFNNYSGKFLAIMGFVA